MMHLGGGEMERGLVITGEIEVEISGVFTTHHSMKTSARFLGELTLPVFSNGGVFRSADGRELVVERTSWWRGWHEMREDGVVIGAARSRGFWRRTMSVGYRGGTYELEPAGFWSRAWYLTDEAGTVLLEVHPRGFFRQRVTLAVKGRVHADLLVFAYYLVNVRMREQSAVASSAAAAGS